MSSSRKRTNREERFEDWPQGIWTFEVQKNWKNPKRRLRGSVSVIGGEQRSQEKKVFQSKRADQLHQMLLMGQERKVTHWVCQHIRNSAKRSSRGGEGAKAHSCSTSGKWNSEPQGDITSPLSDWQLSESQEMTNVGEDEDKRESLCTAGGEGVGPPGRAKWGFLKKLERELPYDPAITRLGIYPKKTRT